LRDRFCSDGLIWSAVENGIASALPPDEREVAHVMRCRQALQLAEWAWLRAGRSRV